MSVLQVRELSKRYGESPVFSHVDLDVAPGEFVAIVGASGVGKSSLLNCLAGLDDWQSGTVHVNGQDIGAMDEVARALWRRVHVGFVFQAFHVLPHLDVAQNVRLPLLLLQETPAGAALDPSRMDARVAQVLQAVGLDGLGGRLPRELSGGQLQRVAIARALVHEPGLLLADEPTGNLDPDTARTVMDRLIAQAREQGCALVLVTHADAVAQRADRVLHLNAHGIDPA